MSREWHVQNWFIVHFAQSICRVVVLYHEGNVGEVETWRRESVDVPKRFGVVTERDWGMGVGAKWSDVGVFLLHYETCLPIGLNSLRQGV